MIANRRTFLTTSAAAAAGVATVHGQDAAAPTAAATTYPQPPRIDRILFSCKFGMAKGASIEERFQTVKDAGYDGIDFDDCGKFTVEQVRNAAYNTGLFVHNAINHTHWGKRFTSGKEADVAIAHKNLDHCLRVSHAAGGSAVLLVIGASGDGPKDVIAERARTEISKHLPLAAALGQRILFENVWNGMFYDPKGGHNQDCKELVDFIDSFNSPWIGSYFDVGNHQLYGNPADWIRQLGYRVGKLDLKGFDRGAAIESGKNGQFRDITKGDIDWADVRKALAEINFNGWTTAEVGGGNVDRLKVVLDHMKTALLG